MNIFYVNDDPILSADDLAYRHVVKMIVESSQMLSTAHRILGTVISGDILYKKTHINHPSNVWIRESTLHYDWVWHNAKRMCELYTLKSGKKHASEKVLDVLITHPITLYDNGFKRPPACVDDDLKHLAESHSVKYAYKAYLNRKYQEWLDRDKPLKVEWVLSKPTWINIHD